jgi:AmmeMemoRadiSam system protein B
MIQSAMVRPPAVSGLFYPESRARLEREVREHLDSASVPATVTPKAVIAPHAGYRYSGPTAGFAFAALESRAGEIEKVVLLGPAHRVPVRGLAVPEAREFETPLGRVPVDQDLVGQVLELTQVTVSDAAHAPEHSLEVEIPFLQITLAEFTLLPLVVGDASDREVAEVLDRVWGGPETIIIVSSDLSHYLPYEEARHVDRSTVDRILRLERPLSHQQACGAGPINGLLVAARRRELDAKLLDLRNSGDTAGGRDGVVGYAAVAFQ